MALQIADEPDNAVQEDDGKTLDDYKIHQLTDRIDRLSPRRQRFYPVVYDLAPSLLAQSYLDPHARLYHFRGHAQVSADRTTEKSEKLKRDDDEIEIIYRRISANEIEVRYGDPNPFAQQSYLTQAELRQVIESHTGFEDLTIKQRGISYPMPDGVKASVKEAQITDGVEPSKLYHHETSIGMSNNRSQMGFETIDLGEQIRSVLDDMGVPEDDLGTIGYRLRSVLKTDYMLTDNAFDHRLLANIDAMEEAVQSIQANHSWQDIGKPENTDVGNQDIHWYELQNFDGSVII